MIGIDTNVLVRYMTEDDPEQTKVVHRFLLTCRSEMEAVFISSVVLCEAAWVLRSTYRIDKARILNAVEHLLSADLFLVERADAARVAIQQARSESGDFADYLIGAIHLGQGCRHTVTFDRDLKNSPAFRVLK
jgi:predicted nucleic-acid-binding protein